MQSADRLCIALERPGARAGTLVPVLFHSLYPHRRDLSSAALAPNQDVTVGVFRTFVEQMLDMGYAAVSPAQIEAGLDPAGAHFMITFDDGYFNNQLALPVLQEFQVPATFFISTDHVRLEKAFWWDAFARELAARGVTGAAQQRALQAVKAGTTEEIESMLQREFGAGALAAQGDLDRPFTATELRRFAASPWVHLGNHTRNHAILPRYDRHGMAEQVSGCQRALAEMTGVLPIAIAYPNGNHGAATVAAARDAGLRMGFTVAPRRSRLPMAAGNPMTIGRFLFDGRRDLRLQCRLLGARCAPSHWLRGLMHSAS